MKKYPSKYSNGKEVSAAQFITEIICEHKAKIDNKDLHYRFWTTPYWEKFYRNQISSAHKLLKKYEAKAVISALKLPESSQTYSLRSPFLTKLIEQESKKILAQNNDFSLEIDRKTKKQHKQTTIKRNIISKLEELDNEY
jgi:hypothetical protein